MPWQTPANQKLDGPPVCLECPKPCTRCRWAGAEGHRAAAAMVPTPTRVKHGRTRSNIGVSDEPILKGWVAR